MKTVTTQTAAPFKRGGSKFVLEMDHLDPERSVEDVQRILGVVSKWLMQGVTNNFTLNPPQGRGSVRFED